MDSAMITAIATIIGALISGVVSLLVSTHQHDKAMALVEYRLGELEEKVDKHNNLVERVTITERDLKTAFVRIDESRQEIKDLKDK